MISYSSYSRLVLNDSQKKKLLAWWASSRVCKGTMQKEAFIACSSCGNGASVRSICYKKNISFRLERAGFAYINAN